LKIPLSYQTSEYDCAPVTFLNALNYLCDREELDPELIKAIYRFSLDCVDNAGNRGKCGTSKQAVQSLTEWISQYSSKKGLGIVCKFLAPSEISMENASITKWFREGGVLLACVDFEHSYHYVLVTAMDDSFVYIFDPYYLPLKPAGSDFDVVEGRPFKLNRRVKKEVFYDAKQRNYALGELSKRECVLMYRTENYQKLDNSTHVQYSGYINNS